MKIGTEAVADFDQYGRSLRVFERREISGLRVGGHVERYVILPTFNHSFRVRRVMLRGIGEPVEAVWIFADIGGSWFPVLFPKTEGGQVGG